MKNIIVAGDSFCASVGWPEEVAKLLNLDLKKFGFGGASWWISAQAVATLPKDEIRNTDIVILCHTNAHRLPVKDMEILRTDFENIDNRNPKQLAVKLYWTYLFPPEVMQFYIWAQRHWFKELSEKFSHCRIINLHCFPQSWHDRVYLSGMNVSPSLTAISLNELGAGTMEILRNCGRNNHLSESNNQKLANEIVRLINNYKEGDVELDLTKFDLKSTHWFEWDKNENTYNGLAGWW